MNLLATRRLDSLTNNTNNTNIQIKQLIQLIQLIQIIQIIQIKNTPIEINKFGLRIDVYAVGEIMAHCYVHFAIVFTLSGHDFS